MALLFQKKIREDFYSAGLLFLVKGIRRFDNKKSNIRTFINAVTKRAFFDYARKEWGGYRKKNDDGGYKFQRSNWLWILFSEIVNNEDNDYAIESKLKLFTRNKEKEACLKNLLESLINSLNEREKKVIIDRYYYGKHFREIGDELSVSKQRVKQIEEASILKMKEKAKSWGS